MILVGGVGHLYQGDLDLGRLAVERLTGDELGSEVTVEDLSYGAVAVSQRLEELRPRRLILVGAAARGREAGSAERVRIADLGLTPEQVQGAVADAVTGHLGLDLVVEVAHGLGTLPRDTVVIEVEPGSVEPSETLSPAGARGLERALELVRAELASVG